MSGYLSFKDLSWSWGESAVDDVVCGHLDGCRLDLLCCDKSRHVLTDIRPGRINFATPTGMQSKIPIKL